MNCVYFMQQSVDGLIKIGFSSDLMRRFRALKNANPTLVLRAVMPGATRRTEDALHERFARLRMEGGTKDWFRPDVDLLAFIVLLPTIGELLTVVHDETLYQAREVVRAAHTASFVMQPRGLQVGDTVKLTAVAERTRAGYGEQPWSFARIRSIGEESVILENGHICRHDELEILPKF
jgi:hypothetical protein